MNGKPIRLMFIQRDPSLRKSGIGNIFLKNLDKDIDAKALYDTFSAFGNILSCKIALDDNGTSKQYGFVHFEDPKVAEKAINKVNGMLLNGKQVYVGKFLPKSARRAKFNIMSFNNLYVKNFGEGTSDEEFREIFEKYGEITSCKIACDEKGNSKGFGFVAFESFVSAQRALDSLDGTLFKGRTLYVARAQKKAERQKELRRHFESLKIERINNGTNIYVKNIHDDIDDQRLCEMFSPFGAITSSKVMREEGISKCFGFVCYSKPEEATKAIAKMNGIMFDGKPLYVALAQSKQERFATLQYGPYMSNAPLTVQSITHQVRTDQTQTIANRSLPASRKIRGRSEQELCITVLSRLPPAERRQVLGEKLYPMVHRMNKKLTGKITGMLLEMDTLRILQMLSDQKLLKEKVTEAELMLQEISYGQNLN